MSGSRACRVCGCTQNSACWSEETGACCWVEADLCSACSGDQPDATRDEPMDLVAAGYPGDEPARSCRECDITEIPTDPVIIDGEVLCWADDDLCSICQDRLHAELLRDAARYRHLRCKQVRSIDIEAGGVFAGMPSNGRVLSGEDLDRVIDREIGLDVPTIATLETRLADCLADIVDAPILTGRDECGGFKSPLGIRIGFFRPELSERAAELLEEAGR